MYRSLTFALLVLIFSVSTVAASDSTTIKVDLNGDGALDTVTLVQSPHKITISADLGATHSASQTLTFGIDASSQDAVCGLPVKLTIVPLDCGTDDGVLPGCRAIRDAKGLELSGSDCDPIYLYWDHQAKRLAWWRN